MMDPKVMEWATGARGKVNVSAEQRHAFAQRYTQQLAAVA